MACPQCGDVCTCSPRPASRAALAEAHDHLWPATDAAWQDAAWRKEIASRVKAHKRRRGAEDDSLTLDFAEDDATFEESPNAEIEPVEEPEPPPPPSRYQRIAMKRAQAQFETGNLIVFPPPQVDPIEQALAEPIPDTPRILEAVPEPPPLQEQFFPVVELDTPHPLLETVPADIQSFEAELPLPVAALSAQATCMAIDSAIAMAAFVLFAWIVRTNTDIELTHRPVIVAVVAFAALFWAGYHFLFLYFSQNTPGMLLTQLAFCTFDDTIPCRATRMRRAAALLLSMISMGMGFFWALLDEDRLGWHDRISRTYLRLL
jgi:uncharacterized RDD family membrane protein YckC